MEFEPEVVHAVRRITDRFIRLHKSTPDHEIKSGLGRKWRVIDTLIQEQVIQQIGPSYLPKLRAVTEFENPEIKDLCLRCTDIVLRGLKVFYKHEGQKQCNRERLEEIIEHLNDFPVEQEMVTIGLLFATDFPNYLGGWQWVSVDSGQISSVGVRDDILDFDGIEAAWQAELERRKPVAQKIEEDLPASLIALQKHVPNESDKASVFVIHGRNRKINQAMFEFLRALGLNPLEWSELVARTGKGSPHISTVIQQGIQNAGAVVALVTPDDLAFLHPALQLSSDEDHESRPSPQGRPNVLFEMGMAFALQEAKTIIVRIGRLRPFSDISGMHVVDFDGSPKARNELKNRLRTAGCPLNEFGHDWLNVGDFSPPPALEFEVRSKGAEINSSNVVSRPSTDVELEPKRQLLYGRAVEILTKSHDKLFRNSQGMPGYLWVKEYPGWFEVYQQLMTRDSITGRARPLIEPSLFKSTDIAKMKAAAQIVEMYLWSSDNHPDFNEIRKLYDLPDSIRLRRQYHDAQLSLILAEG